MNSRNDPDCDYVYKGMYSGEYSLSAQLTFFDSRIERRNGSWEI